MQQISTTGAQVRRLAVAAAVALATLTAVATSHTDRGSQAYGGAKAPAPYAKAAPVADPRQRPGHKPR